MLDRSCDMLNHFAGAPTGRLQVADPAALRQVFDDPNCFSFRERFPGGFTPNFFAGRPVVDLELTIDAGGGATVAIGAQDVLDTYPDESARALSSARSTASTRRGASTAPTTMSVWVTDGAPSLTRKSSPAAPTAAQPTLPGACTVLRRRLHDPETGACGPDPGSAARSTGHGGRRADRMVTEPGDPGWHVSREILCGRADAARTGDGPGTSAPRDPSRERPFRQASAQTFSD